MRRRQVKNFNHAKKLNRWRPSKRNAVMRLALMERPTLEGVLQRNREGCPICGAGHSALRLEECAPRHSQPTSLGFLGIAAKRWVRGTVEAVCLECGSSFADGKIHSWNVAKSARAFADFGNTKFPLPFEKLTKSLPGTILDRIDSRKHHLVHLRARKGLMQKDVRHQRVNNWARSKAGLPLLESD